MSRPRSLNIKKIFIYLILIILTGAVLAQDDYYAYYLQGNAAEEVKKYPEAVELYQKAILLEPNFAPAHNALGFVYLEVENFTEAKNSFDRSLKLNPKFILPLLNKGAACYRQGNLAEAQKLFLKVLELDAKNIRALTNMAVVKFKYGDYWGAWDYYWRAKSVDETYLRERYNKEKTLAEIQAARKRDPENVELKILEEKIKNNELMF